MKPLTIRGAHIWDGGKNVVQRDLHMANGRITAKAANGAQIVDLSGYTLFPGLINAHDHLELNHYPRTKFREVYNNAHEWGEDVNARLNEEPFKTLRSYPLWDRVFIGGLKNLLCGATTVAHHGPQHKPMYRRDFPVRVLKRYGWAHSLHFNTEEEIVQSYRSTPPDVPWFIHLAEGKDEVAASEYKRLKALGCIGANTVIVHGVGVDQEDMDDAFKVIRGIVWCPSTNNFLLSKTLQLSFYSHSGRPKENFHVALGSDSRLTADGDLGDEMEAAVSAGQGDDGCVLEAVTFRAAHLLGLSDVGHLNDGAKADFVIGHTRIRNQLVVRDGIPRIGDPDVMAKFPHIPTVDTTLDDRPKRIHADLARQIHQCQLKEKGLEVDALASGRRFWGV